MILNLFRVEGTGPGPFDVAATVLDRLGSRAKVEKHGIHRARHGLVAAPNDLSHRMIATISTQAFKLLMQIKHQGRVGKTPRGTTGFGVHTNDIEGLATQTQAEIFILRIGTYRLIPRGIIKLMQGIESCP
jgi:hypothetical protein